MLVLQNLFSQYLRTLLVKKALMNFKSLRAIGHLQSQNEFLTVTIPPVDQT